jgi:hypothetical protein
MKRIKKICGKLWKILYGLDEALEIYTRNRGLAPYGSRNPGLLYVNGCMLTELRSFTYSVVDGSVANIQGVLFCAADGREAVDVMNMAVDKTGVLLDVQLAASGHRFQTRGKFTNATLVTGVNRDSEVHFRCECRPRAFP